MTLEIRPARPGDLPGIYDVLGAAFDAPLALFVAQTERDSTFRYRQARLAVVDGRIAAHIRIFARTMMIRGVPMPAGGVGSVATLPQYEKRGLASALLYDVVDEMQRAGMSISFLYTGIPGFYERAGWRVVRQPGFTARARESSRVPHEQTYEIRPIEDHDTPALLRIHRDAIPGTTGAIVRTLRTWPDARQWLSEDAAGCLVAERAGRIVAYVRARGRDSGYEVLEAEHRRGEDAAIAALLSRVGKRAVELRARVTTYAPDDHALATVLRTLPATTWSTSESHVPHPMMMRVVSIERLIDALLPQIRDRARTHRGAPFTLSLHAADGEQTTLAVSVASASVRRRQGEYALDEAGTLDAILGQKRASRLVRPRPPAEIGRRIDAIFPETALHFWNSDRI